MSKRLKRGKKRKLEPLNQEFIVEKVLDHRDNKGKTEYLLAWKDFGPEEYSWEPERNLKKCKSLIEKYKESVEVKVQEEKKEEEEEVGEENEDPEEAAAANFELCSSSFSCPVEEEMEFEELGLEDVMNADLVAVMVFRYLSYKDLLRMALVNKKWNFNARKVLYENYSPRLILSFSGLKYSANIQGSNRMSSRVDKVRWLLESEQKIFKTLATKCSYHDHKPNKEFDSILELLKQPPRKESNGIRKLFINLGDIPCGKSCDHFRVLQTIIMNLCPEKIENLEITRIGSCSPDDSIQLLTRNGSYLFPNLLAVDLGPIKREEDSALYDLVLSGSPRLDHVSRQVFLTEVSYFLQRSKSSLIRELAVDNDDLNGLANFMRTGPMLKSILISFRDFPTPHPITFQLANIWRSVGSVSVASLEKVTTDPYILMIISLTGIHSFYGVHDLELNRVCIYGLSLLSTISISSLFPSLSTVSIAVNFSMAELNRDFLRSNNAPSNNRLSYPTVRRLNLEWYYVTANLELLQILGPMFPNITGINMDCLHFSGKQLIPKTFSSLISGYTPNLEGLSILSHNQYLLSNIEPSILGISHQEWRTWLTLKKKGLDLRQMQYAPSQKSLRDCPSFSDFVWETSWIIVKTYRGLLDWDVHDPPYKWKLSTGNFPALQPSVEEVLEDAGASSDP